MNVPDYLPRDFPTIDEVYTVVNRRLTEEELVKVAHDLVVDALKVYREDPGVWADFKEFLAFHVGLAAFRLAAPEPVAGVREFTTRFVLLCQAESRRSLMRVAYNPPLLEDECDE